MISLSTIISIVCPLFWTIIVNCVDIVDDINNINYNNNDRDVSVDINTLKLVFLIHRHGDRTPIETYPNDPYRNESYWPDGWGQLTLKGKNRMYELGLYLSKRYGKFLKNTPREVLIRSSASDRCLESVALILASLYPPKGRWKWNNNFGKQWQPFPIQTVPHEHDGMLNPGSKCKKAEKIMKDVYKSELVQEYYNYMKPTLLYVQDNTGYVNPIDLIKAEQIFDSLLIEKLNNYRLPAWVDDNVFNKLKEISDITFIFSSIDKRIQRFRAGLLLKDIWKHISNYSNINNINEKVRLHIYSTHDDQLSVFMAALNTFNGFAPPYGSTIMLELHQNSTEYNPHNEPFIRMYYLNETESQKPFKLELYECLNVDDNLFSINNQSYTHRHQRECTIKNFYKVIENLLPNDWNSECENNDNSSKHVTTDPLNFYLISITISITLSAMLFFIYLSIMNHRFYRTSYRLLPIN